MGWEGGDGWNRDISSNTLLSLNFRDDLLSNVWERNHFICTFQSDSHPLLHLVLLLTLGIKRRMVSLFLYLKLEIQDSKHLFSQITWLLSHRCKSRSHQVLLTVKFKSSSFKSFWHLENMSFHKFTLTVSKLWVGQLGW